MFSKTLFLLTRPASLTPHSGQASLASEQSTQRMSPSGHWSITAGGKQTTPHPQHSSSSLNRDHHLHIFILFLWSSLMSPIMSPVLADGDATDKATDDSDEDMSDDSISTGAVMLRNSSSRRKSSFFRNSTLSATVLSSFFFSLKNKCQ